MRLLTLKEHSTTEGVRLSKEECDALELAAPSVQIRPTPGKRDCYDLRPGSTIGAITIDELGIEIQPKIPIDRVLFLLAYALNPKSWRDCDFDFEQRDSIVDAIIPGFVSHIRRAFQRGVLKGYHSVDETECTVRGRIRFNDQIRDRLGIYPPIEVRFDEYSEDILENQLIKAALIRLRRRQIRSRAARSSLRTFDGVLQNVSGPSFQAAPEVTYSRLNEHYRPAIELARLILDATSYGLGHGGVTSSSFLIDMNEVFEAFVVIALRESLGLSKKQFPKNAKGKNVRLDEAGVVRLKPDISWWENGRCVFVGDVKYKKLKINGFKHADLYQLLAYTISTSLPSGILIYAAGESEPTSHQVIKLGKRLDVQSLDLSGSPVEVLKQIDQLADGIRKRRTKLFAITE
ncbi:MAG: McrC family protein [bacterium]|nr:McrC family protein [bacterium]